MAHVAVVGPGDASPEELESAEHALRAIHEAIHEAINEAIHNRT